MQVKILEKHFGGVEFAPEMRVLHLGGQSSANVETLEFALPESWQGKSITLHIQRQDGSLPAPILLDEAHSCAVGKEFTASPCGSWMLLALGEDGFRALTRPARYECYETLATDGDAEISPTQYETFVARVLAYSNSAATSAQEARNSATEAKKNAQTAQAAKTSAVDAAGRAETARTAAESGADRAEAAAARAELTAPEDGAVKSVNGKGGVVTLTAADLGALEAGSADYVERIELTGQVMTLTMGDGSTRTLQTKDTTALTDMTGVLSVEHGGTGKNTALTAADVGAYGKNETYAKTEVYSREETYPKTEVYSQKEADAKFGTPYSLPAATASTLGGVRVGDYLDIDADGTLSAKTLRNTIAASMAVDAKEMLVWNTYVESSEKFTTWDIQIPDNVDKVAITKGKCNSAENATAKEIARGGNTTYSCNYDFDVTFQENGTLHIVAPYKTGYALKLWLSGDHYPTFDELLINKNAVGSGARLVWNTSAKPKANWQTFDIQVPDNVDYVRFKAGYDDATEVDLARGGTTYHTIVQPYNNYSNTTFQADGTLHFALTTKSSYATQIWVTGYHYPTLADLLTETQAAQADTDAMIVDQEYRVTLLELGLDE